MDMMKHWVFGTAALALAGLGCGHAAASHANVPVEQPGAQAQTSTEAGMAGGKMAAMCPMAVSGATVVAADTSAGETLTFSTSSPDRLADLRTRVHAMADMHNRHEAAGATHAHEGMMGGGGDTGSGSAGGPKANMPMPPPATATAEDTNAGARLVLTPKDPALLAQLQSAVRAHADMMQQGRCGMMNGMQQHSH